MRKHHLLFGFCFVLLSLKKRLILESFLAESHFCQLALALESRLAKKGMGIRVVFLWV
jgi:hypothetical protein